MRGDPYREHPILFNGEMVRAILAGRKTQTRRQITWRQKHGGKMMTRRIHDGFIYEGVDDVGWHQWYESRDGIEYHLRPPAEIGDHLWCREAWADPVGARIAVYKADNATAYQGIKWRPSIHMPRWAARLILEVVDVRVEQVQDITGHDATLEGWPASDEARLTALNVVGSCGEAAINWFAATWDSIYAKRGVGWDANPWVWVIEFKVVPT